MDYSFTDRLKHAWNVFKNRDPTVYWPKDTGPSWYIRPDMPHFTRGTERTIVNSVYNRIALDASAILIQHVQLDENGRFLKEIDSGLNRCLNVEANIDQTGRAFRHDMFMSILDEGCVALVPVDTTLDPAVSSSYDINTMRVGKVVEWYPKYVKVNLYNEKTGLKEDVLVPKKTAAIVENPFYSVMNEPNSTMQRLIRKLNILDAIDEQVGSGKLDMIIQLPYIIKTKARRDQAENRRKDIEKQLSDSKYGIAYTDGTEKIVQLNRPVDNNLMSQIEYLTNMLYSQLGITAAIMDGTADEKTMLNYYNRVIEPLVSAFTDAMIRCFLTQNARTRGQSILFFRDPFKLVPVNDIAEIADKFTRNEIMTANEIRQIIGMKPAEDPNADVLKNANMPQDMDSGLTEEVPEDEADVEEPPMTEEEYLKHIADLDALDEQLDELENDLNGTMKHYASPYYDPVKAHEYYEEHKKLKGRKSTSGLNDEGKEAARYVKQQLDAEKKQKIQTHKDQTDSGIESSRNTKDAGIEASKNQRDTAIENAKNTVNAEIEHHKAQMQSQIDDLRDLLAGMDSYEKSQHKEEIQSQIASLREDNKQKRASLREAYKAEATGYREKHKETADQLRSEHKENSANLRTGHKEYAKATREEYDQKYEAELDKIKSEDKFKKKASKKSSSGNSSGHTYTIIR